MSWPNFGIKLWATRGGGALNFGLRTMCHQKDPTFFRSLSPKDPHFYQLSPNDPLFFENFDIFDEMMRNFLPFWPWKPLFLMHFTERPLFLCTVSLKDPLFWHNLSPKDPYIWGAWWHSYVTFICECPPPGGLRTPTAPFEIHKPPVENLLLKFSHREYEFQLK